MDVCWQYVFVGHGAFGVLADHDVAPALLLARLTGWRERCNGISRRTSFAVQSRRLPFRANVWLHELGD
jgi:hypothetical protein